MEEDKICEESYSLYLYWDIPLLIRSPGSELRAELECRDVSVVIEGVEFLATLILLPSASLDVILGMDWLSQHMGQID